MLKSIEKMEPFGFGNSNPVFMVKGVIATNVTRVGSQKEHLKFKIKDQKDGDSEFSAISFSDPTSIKDGDIIDIAFTLRYNVWNERKSIEIRVIDIKIR